MNQALYLATPQGLVTAEGEAGSWDVVQRSLAERRLTSVAARDGVILAGSENGIYRSENGGRSWLEANLGLTVAHIRWLEWHPNMGDLVFAGTEPAAIFISETCGASWQECPEVAALAKRHNWFLPYSPAAGCVRGFAGLAARAYAAAEVGGVLRSDDCGSTWQLAAGSDGEPRFGRPQPSRVHPDVHSINVHSTSADLLFAATGGGLYRSKDGGATWQCLYECYCRAVWVDPDDAGHIVFGPADGVSRNGRIEESCDGGSSWHAATAGMTVPWPAHMVERFVQAGDGDSGLIAVLSNGEVLAAQLQASTLAWRRICPEVSGVTAAAV